MNGDATTNLRLRAAARSKRELGDVTHGNGSASRYPRVDAGMLWVAADLVEDRDAAGRPGGCGASRLAKLVGRDVHTRSAGCSGNMGYLGRRRNDADFRSLRGDSGGSVFRTGGGGRHGGNGSHRGDGCELAGTIGIRRENGFLQRLASSGADLVHGGEAHAAALVKFDLDRTRLKGRGAHAPDMLGQVLARQRLRARGLDNRARSHGLWK